MRRFGMDPLLAAETLLILAERPGDAAPGCGALIAARCRAGRPPFVVVLTDGPVTDAAADGVVRRELAGLGLDGDRMLMFGLAGALPSAGPVFDAAVRAVCFVMWRRDCNLVLALAGGVAGAVARAVAGESGVGLGEYGGGSVRLLNAPRRSVRED